MMSKRTTRKPTNEDVWAALAAISERLDQPERRNIPTYHSGALGRVTIPE